MLHPFKSEWWTEEALKTWVVSIPTYIVGLYYEYGYATISSYDIYNKIDNSVPKKLLMLDPATAKTSPYEKPVPEQLRWYDHWLKGMDTGIMDEPPIKMLVMGEDRYRYETQWPCESTEYKKIVFQERERTDAGEGRRSSRTGSDPPYTSDQAVTDAGRRAGPYLYICASYRRNRSMRADHGMSSGSDRHG